MTNNYITGSLAYGKLYRNPEKSDVDLVIYADTETIKTLIENSDFLYTLRFGKLNLIPFNTDDPEDMERSKLWRKSHEELLSNPPKTKEDAVREFRLSGE